MNLLRDNRSLMALTNRIKSGYDNIILSFERVDFVTSETAKIKF